MKLKDLYSSNKTIISFEVFPPKEDETNLLQEIKKLTKYNPAFCSLTYGAGGSENKSISLIQKIQNEGINVVPHFTCINSNKNTITRQIKELQNLNIENILALRGDIPENTNLDTIEIKHANELVRLIKEKTNLSIGVAGYPEGHIESKSIKSDIEYLKQKVDDGSDAIFTQLFFDNNTFFNFVKKCRNTGINIPIIAGIMPILSKKQVDRMVSLANVSVPEIVNEKLETLNSKDLIEFGIDYSTEQCKNLIDNKVEGLHFFSLNKAYSTSKILDNLNL